MPQDKTKAGTQGPNRRRAGNLCGERHPLLGGRELGSWLHPITRVSCEYYLCVYLTGQVENRDTDENLDAVWIPRQRVAQFIPADRVFPPVLQALEEES